MIRKAVREEIPTIAEIYRHIHEQEQRGLAHIGWLPEVYPVERTAQDAFKRGDLYVYREETVLASAIINQTQVDAYAQGEWKFTALDSEVMVLHTLVVEPAACGRGIGRAFVSFYEKLARQSGCKALRMDTNAINIKARSLYKNLGFREAGIVPCVFNGIPGVQLVLLEKNLCPD